MIDAGHQVEQRNLCEQPKVEQGERGESPKRGFSHNPSQYDPHLTLTTDNPSLQDPRLTFTTDKEGITMLSLRCVLATSSSLVLTLWKTVARFK